MAEGSEGDHKINNIPPGIRRFFPVQFMTKFDMQYLFLILSKVQLIGNKLVFT